MDDRPLWEQILEPDPKTPPPWVPKDPTMRLLAAIFTEPINTPTQGDKS